MKKIKLSERELPKYTEKEELLHCMSHICGAVFGAFVLIMCLNKSISLGDAWDIVGSVIYGLSMIILYTVSSIYHGLKPSSAKRIMRILDHCTINLLIGGTYTPILLSAIRPVSEKWAWTIFAIVWGFAAIATTLTAIDMKKYGRFAMACYIGMGWSILISGNTIIKALNLPALLYLIIGGVVYTVSAALYGIGKKHRYFHFFFHLFALLGSVLQFVCVYGYVLK